MFFTFFLDSPGPHSRCMRIFKHIVPPPAAVEEASPSVDTLRLSNIRVTLPKLVHLVGHAHSLLCP